MYSKEARGDSLLVPLRRNQWKRVRVISGKEEEKSVEKRKRNQLKRRKKNHLKRGTVINEKKEEKSAKDREINVRQKGKRRNSDLRVFTGEEWKFGKKEETKHHKGRIVV